MKDTWNTLKLEEKEAIRASARRLTDDEIAERFVTKGNQVFMRAIRKSTRTLAGPLDFDHAEGETALTEKTEEYEIAEIPLIPADEFDYTPVITPADREADKLITARMAKLAPYYSTAKATRGSGEMAAAGEMASLPDSIDHRPSQSPVKNQAGRGTCVAHASMGLLEAYDHIPDDLSEQLTHYRFMEIEHQPQNIDAGIKTTNAANYLSRTDGHTCEEQYWPYIPDQNTINTMVANGTYAPSAAALTNAKYGTDASAYKIIVDNGLTGESIKNTLYLEALLYQGYNIVVGTWASWDDNDNNGILEPLLDSNGNPLGKAGHAMLIVGYNHTNQYFILKNSWARSWGHEGYGYFSYSFARSCFKYGFVVDKVVPPAPSIGVPRRLAMAPYSTKSLTRAQLRAAILFLKTSQGRYAVCEAYAGDNLLLRNLRVYDPDGTIHLQKNSLIVRGTYLCDLDRGIETSQDADFWWECVRPGENYLVLRNGATAYLAYDLAALNPAQIGAMSLASGAIPFASLSYAIVVGRTTQNRLYKMLVHAKAGNQLQLSYVEVYNANGSRYRYGTSLAVPSSWTYNLDALALGGGNDADIWWHMISNNAGFLETYSTSKFRLVWNL